WVRVARRRRGPTVSAGPRSRGAYGVTSAVEPSLNRMVSEVHRKTPATGHDKAGVSCHHLRSVRAH
ncbi:hypothetical protein SAMN06272735_8986, partial [Streptomyces sp. TLI_55]|uniref:hypothetical protein n=1 Tax=Streptomyces sp. TLI_55 TaxID=1938861 RepID=UPI000BD0559F